MNIIEKTLSIENNKLHKHNKILSLQIGIALQSFKILIENGDKLSKEISHQTLNKLNLIEHENMS